MFKLRAHSCFLLVSLLSTRILFATTYSWTNGNGDGIWNESGNWTPTTGVGYPSVSGDIASFPISVNPVTVTAPITLSEIQTAANGTGVVVSGTSLTPITFDSGGTVTTGFFSSPSITLNIPVVIQGSFLAQISAPSGGNINLGDISETPLNSGSTVTIFSSLTGSVQMSGSNANTYTGTTTMEGGAVTINKPSGITAIPGNLNISTAASLNAGSDQFGHAITVTADSSPSVGRSWMFTDATIGTLICGLPGANLFSFTQLTLTSTGTALNMVNTTLPGSIFLTGASGGDVVVSAAGGTAVLSGAQLGIGSVTRVFNISLGGAGVDMQVQSAITDNGAGSPGGVNKQGSGVLQFTNASNTYFGPTIVTAGTLQAGAANVFPSTSDFTVNATLDLNNNSQTIGLLSGSDTGIVKLGSGTLRTGTASDSTFAGNITDGGSGGSLVKQNGGNFILSGAGNVFGGTTMVSGGRLSVNGSLTSSGGVTVASLATLGGTGTIVGPVGVSGTLSPGNSIGSLHVSPSVTLNTNSTYNVEISPTSASETIVTGSPGTFTIGSNVTLIVSPDPGVYPPHNTYTIIDTTGGSPGGVSGTFANIIVTRPFFEVVVKYDAEDVLLTEINTLPFNQLITKGNAGEVAACLDALAAPSGSDSAFVQAELRQLATVEEVSAALDLMQPSQFTALALAQENTTLYVKDTLFQRLYQSAQICSPLCKTIEAGSGRKLERQADYFPSPEQEPVDFEQLSTIGSKRKQKESSEKNRGVFWVAPFGGLADQKKQTGQVGYDTVAGGLSVGADFASEEHWIFGGALGYSYENLRWEEVRGSSKMENAYGAIYSSFACKHAYALGSLMGSYNKYNSRRNISFGEGLVILIDRTASSKHAGFQGSAHLQGGLLFGSRMQFAPFIEGDFIYVHENSFSEHGASSLDLHVDKKNSNFLQGEAGFEISRCFYFSDRKVIPALTLSGIREWRFLGKQMKSSFHGSSCVMKTIGMNPDRTLLSAALGVTLLLPDENRAATIHYQGKFGERYIDNRLLAQFLFRF